MASESPECRNMIDFQKVMKAMPDSFRGTFEDASRDTLSKVMDAGEGVVTVWEVSDDLDGVFQVMEVLFKLKGAKKKGPGMVIVSQETKERDAYGRLVECLRYWVDGKGDAHLDGTATAFGSVVVVKGVDYDDRKADEDKLKKIAKRIDAAIGKVIKMTTRRSSTTESKLTWHHGPIISLLLTWINYTSATHRNALTSITLAAPLTFTSGAKPSSHGLKNTPQDIALLSKYAAKLSIPVLFLDPTTQLLHYPFPSTYMYYLGFYITLFLPATVSTPHYHKALDALVQFAFTLRAHHDREYGYAVVKKVKSHLPGERSRQWARSCIDPTSYNLAATKSPSDESVYQAITLADCPWATFADSHTDPSPLPYFTRIPISPNTAPSTTSDVNEMYIAAPIAFDFQNSTFRISSSTPFRVLVPRPGVDLAKATKGVQTAMTAMLQRVREVKRLPRVGELQAKMWNDAVGAIAWALGKGRVEALGKKERERVELFGRSLVVSGCWGVCVGAEEERREGDGESWGREG